MNKPCKLCQNNVRYYLQTERKYNFNGNRCAYCRGNITPWVYKKIFHESCRCGVTERIRN